MSSDGTKNPLDLASKIISVLFHPLFMPVYGLAIILSSSSPFGYLPFHVKRLLFIIILINNVSLPLSFLPLFMYLNLISSWTITDRKERSVPLVITTLLYAATAFIIFRFPIQAFFKAYIFSIFFISLLTTVVNLYWRISLHAIGAGALVAVILQLAFKMYSPVLWHLIFFVIAAGLVLSARLRLNLHNSSEVWWGFILGLAGLSFSLIILQ